MAELSFDAERATLAQRLRHWATLSPDTVALRQKEFGLWRPVTWAQYDERARAFAGGLAALGLAPAAKVAIVSENRQEWVYAQLGCGMAGAVTVGIYPTSPAPEVEYLLRSADAEAVVCEDQEQLDKVLEVRARLPLLEHLIVVDPKGLRRYRVAGLVAFDELLQRGRAYLAEHPAHVDEVLARQSEDDIALMIFTSGSTGRPKAAMLSYGNINAMARGTQAIYRCTPADSTLSYLPLCHVAEQIYTVDLALHAGVVVNFAESLRTVQDDLRQVAPTLFLGVPRIWEKLHSAIEIKLREAGGLREALARRALRAVGRFGGRPRAAWTVAERATYFAWYWVVLRALTNFIGLRECRLALSGAAPIAPQMLSFFRTLGLAIREGYGMTECAGIATVQRSDASPVGTVGSAIPGLQTRLADDGELWLRGPTVFKGYYRNEQATREAVDADGWLHTGDIAVAEGDELRIVDRKKDIMITAGGKNITPSEIENALKCSAYIKEAVVVADRRPFVSALIQIDFDTVGRWAEEAGLAYTHFRSLAEHSQVRDLVKGEVDRANERMPQVQQVRRFHLLTKELDHDDGEVTATMKVRRASIAQKYADEIEGLYRGRETVA